MISGRFACGIDAQKHAVRAFLRPLIEESGRRGSLRDA